MKARYALLASLTFLACSNDRGTEAVPFSEHRPSRAVSSAMLHLGEDCSQTGYEGCRSALCGHFSAAPEGGYFCTRSCTSLLDCPGGGWTCAQVFPGEGGTMCVAPANWQGSVAVMSDGGVE
jgi:hypothetical protein